ncbi:MAG TPA: hypothetical protein VMM92_04590 [Thermoanaerobaculia bacterium]|nr:hypothetical protein [Thermoanaerobaculia bacterium]
MLKPLKIASIARIAGLAGIASLLPAPVLLAAAPPTTHVVAGAREETISTAADARFALGDPSVAATAPGEFVVAWSDYYAIYQSSQQIGFEGGIKGRQVGLQATPKSPEFPIEPIGNALASASPRVAGNRSGRFVVSWELSDGNFTGNQSQFHIKLRQFGADTQPTAPEVDLYTSGVGLTQQVLGADNFSAVAMDGAGRSFVAWLQPLPLVSELYANAWAQTFDASGKPTHARFEVTNLKKSEASPATAMDGQGNSILVFQAARTGGSGLYLRRYDRQGRQLGSEVLVTAAQGAANPKVASGGAAGFVVVWSERQERIRAQLYDAGGASRGAPLTVSSSTQPFASTPDVAADSRGNFVVVWEAGDPATGLFSPVGRVYSQDGTPEDDEIAIPAPVPGGPVPGLSQGRPAVALTDSGTFLVTWATSNYSDSPAFNVVARSFRVLSNRDRCVYRGNTFLCGSASGELTPVSQLGNGVAAGDRPFLADFDGTGADLPCIRHGNAFVCDEGGGAALIHPFGAASQLPLVGDIDGDGRVDPCVRRGRFFLCDTAHDGGTAEVKIAFGLAGDLPLLGDIDGDGRADPCLFRPGQLLCDLQHNGTASFSRTEDTQDGDVPLLGDVNGDGRAEFCVVRGTALLCDTDGSGALTAQPLAIEAGDVVLLGRVDRL